MRYSAISLKTKGIFFAQLLGWSLVPTIGHASRSPDPALDENPLSELQEFYEKIAEGSRKEDISAEFSTLSREARDAHKARTPKLSEQNKAKRVYQQAKAELDFVNRFLTTPSAKKALGEISANGLVESGKEADWAKDIAGADGAYRQLLQEKIQRVMSAPAGSTQVEYIQIKKADSRSNSPFGDTLLSIEKTGDKQVSVKVALDLNKDKAAKDPYYKKAISSEVGLKDSDLEKLVRENISKGLAGTEVKLAVTEKDIQNVAGDGTTDFTTRKEWDLGDDKRALEDLSKVAKEKLVKGSDELVDNLNPDQLDSLKEEIEKKEAEAKKEATPNPSGLAEKMLAAKQAMIEFARVNPEAVKDKDACAVLKLMAYAPERLPKAVVEDCDIKPIVVAKEEPAAKKESERDENESRTEAEALGRQLASLEDRCRARRQELGLPSTGMNNFFDPLKDISSKLSAYTYMKDIVDVKARADAEGGRENPFHDFNAYAAAIVKRRYTGPNAGQEMEDAEGTAGRIFRKYEKDINDIELKQRFQIFQDMMQKNPQFMAQNGITDPFHPAITQQIQSDGLLNELKYVRDMAGAVGNALLSELSSRRGNNAFARAGNNGAGYGTGNSNNAGFGNAMFNGGTDVQVSNTNFGGSSAPVGGNTAIRPPSNGLPGTLPRTNVNGTPRRVIPK